MADDCVSMSARGRDRAISYDVSSYDMFKVDEKYSPSDWKGNVIERAKVVKAHWEGCSIPFKGARFYEIHSSIRVGGN